MTECIQIAYGKMDFNFLMRSLEFYVEKHNDGSEKVIEELLYKIKEVHSFQIEGETKIIIYLTSVDMANIMNVYESQLFYTYEAQALMHSCRDWFGELKSGL